MTGDDATKCQPVPIFAMAPTHTQQTQVVQIFDVSEVYSVMWLDRILDERRTIVMERSRVRVSPAVLSSTALDKPLMHTYFCHQAV